MREIAGTCGFRMIRRVGVEEEFLIVDNASGHAVALGEVLDRLSDDDGLSSEMKQEQIEACTLPRISLEELAQDIIARRVSADSAARAVGARSVALATSPFPVQSTAAPGTRIEQMMQKFGVTAVEQLTCGCHVHVEVESDEEGVAILDRIRIWLPVLMALTSNSPFSNGVDTSYASFRSQAWNRWPTAGPSDIFGSAHGYHTHIQEMLNSGVPLDLAQIYLDARLSHHHPTVEIRVADVCLFADDAVLLAALVRGLAETAARQWRAGAPPVAVPTVQLRLASWQAGRYGIGGDLVDPLTCRPRPAFEVVMSLLDHLQPVLKEQGELSTVEFLLFQLLARGTGADRQRAAFAQGGGLSSVITDAVHTSSLPTTLQRDAADASLLGSQQEL
ncbi:YbdK family carboxylate-amine ligase [Pseudarthrobacter phenanthrenivorans]|nr:YbdK family carboxylate-amine ligase [Pseudarthrobacter phenanthrenivorans]